jgi:RNA polymerase sigma factor (sigma-70 family)
MNLSEEQELIQEAQKNNESFVKLYDMYYSRIFGYIFRRTLDLEKSKDICSETFLKALVNIKRFRWKNIPFSAWLYRIATNEMNMADRLSRYRPASLEKFMQNPPFDIIDPNTLETEKLMLEKQMKQNEDFIAIQQKLLLLPSKYQEVIALRYFEEKSIKEIADILDKKEGTVKSLLSRGIDKLKDLL